VVQPGRQRQHGAGLQRKQQDNQTFDHAAIIPRLSRFQALTGRAAGLPVSCCASPLASRATMP
jgi:hypothetical protein